jgi:zinc/manganese transport system ATP-binding protein/zinc transport system ATP-binding protein
MTLAEAPVRSVVGDAEALVRFEGVSASYGGPAVLEDVDLAIARGALVGIVGPSGAGKTTLLRAMVGQVPQLRGRVTVNDRDVTAGRTANVGWVPQLETVDWDFPATVREVVLMGRWRRASLRPWTTREDRDHADRVLERLGIGGLGGRQIRELSGGQQQRVFLARALSADPDLLLLDEPTSGVDIRTRDEVLHLLADLNRQGVTIVLTTHELNSVAAHLPWVVCVNRRVIAQGDPDVVFTAEVLNATYDADLRVVREDGHVLIADAAPHRLRDALRHRHDGYEHSHHEHDGLPHTHLDESAEDHMEHRHPEAHAH